LRKYTEEEIAKNILAVIKTNYKDPEYFHSQFKANINRKVKSLIKKDLTDEELKRYALKFIHEVIK
jgi:DNA gyrase/topoisomerase IV subunit B